MVSKHLPRPSASRLAALALGLVLWAAAACTYDSEPVDNRRCINHQACIDRFGEDYFCRPDGDNVEGGICQEVGSIKCDREEDLKALNAAGEAANPGSTLVGDEACDDQVYCNGEETCAPDDPNADAFGCLRTARDLDDSIACTVDTCDEDNDRVVHDPYASCECAGADDDQCALRYGGTCVESASCDTATFTCVFTLKAPTSPCEDGYACTQGDTCDDQGACVSGATSDAACANNSVCDGAERCAPTEEGADAEGCVQGLSAAQDPANDDGVECTQTICDEERPAGSELSHAPTPACECSAPADCQARSPQDACKVFRCDSTTSFTCVETGSNQANGASCDDGAACSADDQCVDGACVGTPVNSVCGGGQCAPDDLSADSDGCVVN